MTGRAGLRAMIQARIGRLRLEAELDTGPGTLVLIGPNGAGKSCLLAVLLGVLQAERARITVGRDVLFDSERGVDLPLEQRRLGYVPQDYALFPHLTVRGNVAFAMGSQAAAPRGRERERRVRAVLDDLGLTGIAEQRPPTLSGGQQQRVALARALSVEPRALLLDEPLGALDFHSRQEVRAFLADTLRTLGLPTVVVTHDAEDARLLGDRIAVLEAGRISQLGSWSELAAAPRTRFVRDFVRAER